MQPRALTNKKNKIKCILLELPSDFKGKSVNFSQLLSLWHFYSILSNSWYWAEMVEKVMGTPTSLSISSRLGPSSRGCWAESSSVSPSLPGHASRHSEGPYRDPVLRLATLATLPSSSQNYKACEVGIISDLEFSHLLSSSWPTRKQCVQAALWPAKPALQWPSLLKAGSCPLQKSKTLFL